MTEDLERREKAFAAERNEEHAARARLKVRPAVGSPRCQHQAAHIATFTATFPRVVPL